MIKEATRDGLRAVKNVYDDKAVVPGAGSFEIACSLRLNEYCKDVQGKAKLGIQAFAEALLVIPKVLLSLCRLLLKTVDTISRRPLSTLKTNTTRTRSQSA